VSAADYVVFKRTSGFGALQDQVLRAVDNSWQSMSTEEQDGLLRDLFSLVWPSSHGQTQEVKAELQKTSWFGCEHGSSSYLPSLLRFLLFFMGWTLFTCWV